MLKSISLENYKCFKELKNLEIAPLTVLCGVNSSGKSSILKSLLMLKQSFEDNVVSNGMLFNGKYIDNGTFEDLLYGNSDKDYFTIENSFELQETTENDSKDNRSFRNLKRLYYMRDIDKIIIKYSISIANGGEPLYSNKIKDIKMLITVITLDKHIVSTINLKCISGSRYSIECHNIPDVSGTFGDLLIPRAACYFSNMTLNSIYEKNMKPDTKLYIPTITSLFNVIPNQYMQLQYIAPLRENPKRRYVLDKEVVDVGVSGENTPLLLARLKKRKKSGVMASDSEDDYIASKTIQDKYSFISLVKSWMKYMELGELRINDKQPDLIKIEINDHNLADVGFGVSQALPIIAEGIVMASNQTLLLEQPEIHLHPKMQMRMADFLLSLACNNKSVIVETHSDHFVDRLIRRYMEDDAVRDIIKIYFVDKKSDGYSTIEPVVIDEIEGAICDNENFFFQFAGETEKIVDAGCRNLQKQEQMNKNVVTI